MRVVSGVLLLLLCLHSLRGQILDPSLVPGSCDEQVAQALKQKMLVEDTGTLRDIVVELKVQLRSMEARVKESEVKVNEMRVELAVTKVHIEQLQKENVGKAQMRLHFRRALVVEYHKKQTLLTRDTEFVLLFIKLLLSLSPSHGLTCPEIWTDCHREQSKSPWGGE